MAPVPQPFPKTTAKYRLYLEDLRNEGTKSLLQLPNLSTLIEDAVHLVFTHLYTYYGKPLPARSVTLYVESSDGVAYTQGTSLDEDHKEIHLSQEYISNYVADKPRFVSECTGVVVHEMVHCWQQNCLGSAPGGLIEGMADYVRLKSGLAPPHWTKETKDDLGQKWDDGYQKTAWFLEWLEARFGVGTVSRMNAYMDGRVYDETKFWNGLFGESVDSLWKKYLKQWDDEHGGSGGDDDDPKVQEELRLRMVFQA